MIPLGGRTMNFRWMGKSASIAILSVCLVFAGISTACNPTSEVNLVAQLAQNLANSCAGFGLNAVDVAACQLAAGAISASAQIFDSCYTSYEASKSSGGSTLQAFEACAKSELTNIQATLAAFRISNAGTQSIIVTAINLVISAIEVVLSFFGVASKAMISHAASAGVSVGGIHDWESGRRARKVVVTNWNLQVCSHVSTATCVVQ
jgi:hypothetical protein